MAVWDLLLQKAAKRKKIHAFKSKMRTEQLEVAQNKRQNDWQQFQTTKGKAKKVKLLGCCHHSVKDDNFIMPVYVAVNEFQIISQTFIREKKNFRLWEKKHPCL